MSTLTLPKVAADLDSTGHVFYAFCSALGDVLWCAAPVLPDATFHWAGDELVYTPHATLDVTTIEALLFCSALNTGAEPDEDELLDALDATLTTYRCHVEQCATRHLEEGGDYPEETARRWTWCVRCAARLLSVTP